MANALQELSALSLDLQSRQMTFVRAHKRIKIVIAVFLARKYKPGKFLDEALGEIEEHKGVVWLYVQWCAYIGK